MAETMTIPSATRHLAAVRRFVKARARAAGLSDASAAALQLAVDEACTNAIAHAYGGREDGDVIVETRREDDLFVVIVRHHGTPFDPEKYHPPRLEEALRRRRRGGFGVVLMDRLCDEVQFRQGEGFAEVRLAKKIEAA